MKYLILSLILSITNNLLYAKDTIEKNYTIDSALSNINITTIKKSYIVENANISNVTGSFKDKVFSVSFGFQNIDTGVSIRNERLNEVYFMSKLYPSVEIKGMFSEPLIAPSISTMTIQTNISFYNQSKTIDIPVIISHNLEYTTVSTVNPVIIKAEDFNIPSINLEKLSELVGNIAISDQVPVTFNLVFKREK